MPKIIAIANPKGGVGKTTTAINLAASLAIADKKILIIDLDPNGAVQLGLGFEDNDIHAGIFEILLGTVHFQEAVHPFQFPRFDFIPCNVNHAEREQRLLDLVKNRIYLKNRLMDLERRGRLDYDYIIIDTPPTVNDLTTTALTAATSVLIPLQCGYFAMQVVKKLIQHIRRVRTSMNPDIYLEGILLNFYDRRTRESQKAAKQAKSYFKNLVFQTVIPRNTAIGYATFEKKPVVLVDATSPGAVAYMSLAKEIIHNNTIPERNPATKEENFGLLSIA
ncbi:MAG: AAA family ATPase [Calditrichia bacterium]